MGGPRALGPKSRALWGFASCDPRYFDFEPKYILDYWIYFFREIISRNQFFFYCFWFFYSKIQLKMNIKTKWKVTKKINTFQMTNFFFCISLIQEILAWYKFRANTCLVEPLNHFFSVPMTLFNTICPDFTKLNAVTGQNIIFYWLFFFADQQNIYVVM